MNSQFDRLNDSRSLKDAFSVLLCRSSRFSNNVSIFCGGSLREKSGLRFGNKMEANCDDVSDFAIMKILGKMYGSNCVSFIYVTRV